MSIQHPSYPQNMTVCSEPDYCILISDARNIVNFLVIGKRAAWKRLTAIHHARYYAARNPAMTVRVELAP